MELVMELKPDSVGSETLCNEVQTRTALAACHVRKLGEEAECSTPRNT